MNIDKIESLVNRLYELKGNISFNPKDETFYFEDEIDCYYCLNIYKENEEVVICAHSPYDGWIMEYKLSFDEVDEELLELV